MIHLSIRDSSVIRFEWYLAEEVVRLCHMRISLVTRCTVGSKLRTHRRNKNMRQFGVAHEI